LLADVTEGSIVKGKSSMSHYGVSAKSRPAWKDLSHQRNHLGQPEINAMNIKMDRSEARVVTIDRGDRKMSLSINA
jgi:hypothetical protein